MVTILLTTLLSASLPAIVQVPVANMFSQATEDADVVSQAFYATPVTVLEERAGYGKFQDSCRA